ncbi:39S ribosomal protein L33, mitochondrial [Lemmus lemmus]
MFLVAWCVSLALNSVLYDFRTILVRLVSQAGTGFSFNHKRSRLREKLTLLHYDPIGKAQSRDVTTGKGCHSREGMSQLERDVIAGK